MAGALAGGLFSGHLMENYGRQSTLILLSIPSAAGWLCIIYAQSVQSLYLGRILTGVSVGMATMAYPVTFIKNVNIILFGKQVTNIK